jgi:hypothetical protein
VDKEIKAQWVAALRSGEYEQGRGYLRTSDGKFCCLGVLCDLAAKAGVVRVSESDDFAYGALYGLEDQVFGLPAEVRDWAGGGLTPEPYVKFTPPGEAERDFPLSALNDHKVKGQTFAQIADLIDAQL